MRHRPSGRLLAGLVGALLLAAGLGAAHAPGPVAALDRNEARILAGPPSTFGPAAAGDVTTAAVTAQLYETLTTYDAALTLQPALAESWDVATDGQSVVFHLRPDLEFSDGSPLTADDVVGSWLRIIDPNAPAPLAALMLDVKGARDHITGRETDPAKVGLKASGNDVEVQLEGPGSDFPAIVSSPLYVVACVRSGMPLAITSASDAECPSPSTCPSSWSAVPLPYCVVRSHPYTVVGSVSGTSSTSRPTDDADDPSAVE